MSVSTYGIYLAYPPIVKLRGEGLGRYLAAFLKGAADLRDVQFVIVCPSWFEEKLQDLFESEGVPTDHFRICCPRGRPYLLSFYGTDPSTAESHRLAWTRRSKTRIVAGLDWVARHLVHRLAKSHSVATLLILLLEAIVLMPAIVAMVPFAIAFMIVRRLSKLTSHFAERTGLRGWTSRAKQRLKYNSWTSDILTVMIDHEAKRIHDVVRGLRDVRAWYCPTAFWPGFNLIAAPRLMCVPDVVLTDFPVGFCKMGEGCVRQFENVQAAIRSGDHLVTYSESTKWNTLVDRYGIPAERAHVIPHAPQTLARHVRVHDFPDKEATASSHCRELLAKAFLKAVNPNGNYAANFKNKEVRFLFYASQFRPSKNLLNLLRAYTHLLRRRLVGHKLLLTGLPSDMPEVEAFIVQQNLQNDVLCLYGLDVDELAACYKLAELAVNPSLTEGGFPFTFTEALSVDTPVVMARIEVSEAVLQDPETQDMTFFDPYDWRDIANQIEWALENRGRLLKAQRKTYEQLKRRTWKDVAREHVDLLEKIAIEWKSTAQERRSNVAQES